MRYGCLVGCGKTPHSETEAWRIARKFRSKGDATCHAYHCFVCGRWHVGFNREQAARRSKEGR